MIYILNALIPPTSLPANLKVSRAGREELERAIEAGAKSYIRHPGTAKLLGLEPYDGFCQPKAGDVLYVVRLASGDGRPARGTEVDASWDDLEVLKVTITA